MLPYSLFRFLKITFCFLPLHSTSATEVIDALGPSIAGMFRYPTRKCCTDCLSPCSSRRPIEWRPIELRMTQHDDMRSVMSIFYHRLAAAVSNDRLCISDWIILYHASVHNEILWNCPGYSYWKSLQRTNQLHPNHMFYLTWFIPICCQFIWHTHTPSYQHRVSEKQLP